MRLEYFFNPASFSNWEEIVPIFPEMHRLFEGLRGFHLEFEDDSGKTLLHRSAAAGNIAQTYAVVILGGDPEAQDDLGETPLHKAVKHGAIANIQALLAAGANPNTPTEKNVTPLQLAFNSKHNRTEMIRVLLEAGGDPDIVLEKFEPLIRATMSEHEREIYQEIIDYAQETKKRQRVRTLAFVNEKLTQPNCHSPMCLDALKIVARQAQQG